MIKKQNMSWAWLSLALFGFLGICIKLHTTWISWFDTTGTNLMPSVTWANTTIFEAIANLGSPAVSLLVAVVAAALTWREFRTQAILFGLAQFGGAGLLLGIIWIGLVAASRVYLRAHYPSDILGSLLLAGFWWPTGQFLINKWALKRQKEANEA